MKTKKNFITLIIGFIFSIIMVPFFSTPVYATTSNGVTYINENTTSDINEEETYELEVEDVSVHELSDLIEKKTYDVVNLMQVFAKPFASVIFIACAILSLFGAITKGGYLSKGLVGMFISGVMYTAIMYAPEIEHFFATWLSMK